MRRRPPLPGGARVALSLTFDDARESQLDAAVPILDAYSLPATFFVLPDAVGRRPADWRAVTSRGHEIGNHTLTHPCSANFAFSRANALEEYSVHQMEAEIDQASGRLEKLLGLRPRTFAYPCGQSFLGRGEERTSYVPLVARRFVAARGYGSETANDLRRCDLAHLEAFTIDGLDTGALVGLVEAAETTGRWAIMAGHDVGGPGEQTVLVESLVALCERAVADDVWVATVAEVADFVLAGVR